MGEFFYTVTNLYFSPIGGQEAKITIAIRIHIPPLGARGLAVCPPDAQLNGGVEYPRKTHFGTNNIAIERITIGHRDGSQ